MRLNTALKSRETTHEGGRAWGHLSPDQALRRSVLSCLLWEDQFYEDGVGIAERIVENARKVKPDVLAALAVEAREAFNLRHAPLLLLVVLSETGRGDKLVADTVERVVKRPDEMGELLAILWRDGRKMVPAQMRKGLARAFAKFDEYQLAKYDRNGAIKLRDVLRLVRPKPETKDQSALYKRVKDRTLATPDTWEVSLSGGADKKGTFERMLRDEKLGYMALLRNLRNMNEAGVDEGLVRDAILARKGAKRILPFRYVAAARAAPRFEAYIDEALSAAISEMPVLPGKTIVLVDVSASMDAQLSQRSDLTRMDAAAALASIIHGDLRVFSFSAGGMVYWGQKPRHDILVEVPPRRGMAGIDAVIQSQEHGGTMLGQAVKDANQIPHDRLIVITDEQSHDPVPDPAVNDAYMINVASYNKGVGYGKWRHIDGFSEAVLRFIHELEASRLA